MPLPVVSRRNGPAGIVVPTRPAGADAPSRPGLDPAAGFFRQWIERIRCRRELMDLAHRQPDSVLEDAGISRPEALRLAAQPVRPPWGALFAGWRGGF